MEKISVIVPIYNGQKYIEGIIRQLERCVKTAKGGGIGAGIELVLINDNPDDKFRESYSSAYMEVRTIEADRNRGIHGARVRGLLHCTGAYIVFLDQDDKICQDYFRYQSEKIGDADAVVCRAINGGRQFYNNDFRFEEAVSFSYMLTKGNGILSPGQVLMRKSAVPEIWTKTILRHNGADDWFLWLCMMNEGKRFLLNQRILFEHVINENNCSGSTLEMFRSEKEVYSILKECGCFSGEAVGCLGKALENGMELRLQELDRLKKMITAYDTWLLCSGENRAVEAFLQKAGYRNVAIYGMGRMGLALYRALKTKVNVTCFIDRNADFLETEIPVFKLDDDIPESDLIIIALVDTDNRILESVLKKVNVPVRKIEDVLGEALREKIT